MTSLFRGREVRLYINGVEVPGVTDMEFTPEVGGRTVVNARTLDPFQEGPRQITETHVDIDMGRSRFTGVDLSAATGFIPDYRRQPEPADPYNEDWHAFQQDPEFYPAKVCEVCDMWPQHHNHAPVSNCYCQECDPNGRRMSDRSYYNMGDEGGTEAVSVDSATWRAS